MHEVQTFKTKTSTKVGSVMLSILFLGALGATFYLPFDPQSKGNPNIWGLVAFSALLWGTMATGSIVLLIKSFATIVVDRSNILYRDLSGSKSLSWACVSEIKRSGLADRSLRLVSSDSKIDVESTFFYNGDRLRDLILAHRTVVAQNVNASWRTTTQPVGLFLVGFTALCAIGTLAAFVQYLMDPAKNRIDLGAVMGMLTAMLALVLLILDLRFEVNSRGVLSKGIFGNEKRIDFVQIRSISIGSGGNNSSGELMTLEGENGKIFIGSATTPNYAEIRDFIIENTPKSAQKRGILP